MDRRGRGPGADRGGYSFFPDPANPGIGGGGIFRAFLAYAPSSGECPESEFLNALSGPSVRGPELSCSGTRRRTALFRCQPSNPATKGETQMNTVFALAIALVLGSCPFSPSVEQEAAPAAVQG